MKKEEFLDAVFNRVKEIFPNCVVQINEVEKPNGIMKTGIVCRNPDSDLAPVTYIDDILETINMGKIDEDTGMDQIVERVSENAHRTLEADIDILKLRDFDLVKDSVYGRLISFADNKERLKDAPTVRWNNLVIEYRILIAKEQGVASALVDNAMLKEWGISKSELVSTATENTKRIFPYQARSMMELLKDRFDVSPEGLGIEDMELDLPMIVMSNVNNMDGAICMTDTDFVKSVSERYFGGESIFILPSSRHEVIAVSKDFKAREMLDMVSEINKTVLDKSDYLSTSVYEYDATKQKVHCVATETPVEKKKHSR